MTRIFLALLVLAAWVALTAIAAWAVPPRHNPDAQPDLAYDEHWALRTPPNPVQYDKVTRRVTATSTTTSGAGSGALRAPVGQRAVSRRASPSRPPPSSGGVEQWRDEVAVYSGWNVDLMLAIMGCESKGNPNAYNRSGATGLFQILDGPYDPVANIALAHSMWLTRGTQPWDASASCWRN